jgi:DNA-binding CsgD family transcriptional regulator
MAFSASGAILLGKGADAFPSLSAKLDGEPGKSRAKGSAGNVGIRVVIADDHPMTRAGLVRRVKDSGLPVGSLMLTSYDAQQYVMASLRAGAKGYILKTASPEELAGAIRTVAKGGIYLDAEISRVVGGQEIVPEALSNREREVLILTSKGLSSKETAGHLYISERTVQTHLASVYDKLGARNKTEAMLLALKYGVMTLEELIE